MGRFVVGISGASGTVLAFRLLQSLAEQGHSIDLVMSKSAVYTASIEMGADYTTVEKCVAQLAHRVQENITIHSIRDVGSSISSGSYLVDGMVIIPCSMATVGAINAGLGDDALRRAADVTLKEKRPLILVPRESPLSTIHLENLCRLSQLGVMIVPPVPAWYPQPKTVEDIEKFIVGKVLDLLHIPHALYKRWE